MFVVYSRVLDDEDAIQYNGLWSITNDIEYTVAEIKSKYVDWATDFKVKKMWLDAKSQFIGTFVE